MANPASPLFSFVSTGLHPGTFHVVRFRGQEGLSSLYRFEILLLSEDTGIDPDLMLSSAATFTIHAADGEQESPYHGVLEGFQQLHQVGRYALYRAVLVPRLWSLTLTSHNRIFLDQTPEEIIGTCLKDGGLPESDFDMRIRGQDDPRKYVCQYNESHFQFFSRWAERYGYYYYFDQSGTTEKLILTDTRMAHEKLRGQPVLDYADMSGLDAFEAGHVVKDFTMSVSPLPQKVTLKSYNYEKPDLDLQVEQEVEPLGRGEVYVYGQEFLTIGEGRKLARLRAEELQCRSRVFDGVSNIAFMTPGYTFTLRRHYRPDCNTDYLITSVEHEGAQEAWLTSGLGVDMAGNEDRPSYRNRFQCIPAAVQYRPSPDTVAPKIAGTLHAKIDAAGSGEYAELDAQGRYKVIMPFDLSGRSGGKASIWLRKAESYAGSNHGMHFPLHKGTEVMIAFVDGDPNRPFILSAMANPSAPSVVTKESQTQSRISTAGGNKLHFEDSDGNQGIRLSTPTAGTFIRMGKVTDHKDGDPDSDDVQEQIEALGDEVEELKKEVDGDEGTKSFLGLHIKTDEHTRVESGNFRKFVHGNEFTWVADASEEVVMGDDSSVVLGTENSLVAGPKLEVLLGAVVDLKIGGVAEFHFPKKWEISPVHTEIKELKQEISDNDTSIRNVWLTVADARTEVVEERAAMEGKVNLLQEKCNQLAESQQTLIARVSTISDQVQDVTGKYDKVSESITTITEECQDLSSRMVVFHEEITGLIDAETVIRSNMDTIAEELTELVGEKFVG